MAFPQVSLEMFVRVHYLSIVKGTSSCFTFLSGDVLGNFCLTKTLIDFSLEILLHDPKMKKEHILKKDGKLCSQWFTVIS